MHIKKRVFDNMLFVNSCVYTCFHNNTFLSKVGLHFLERAKQVGIIILWRRIASCWKWTNLSHKWL